MTQAQKDAAHAALISIYQDQKKPIAERLEAAKAAVRHECAPMDKPNA